jgi:small subunit ribosomal protein S4
VNIPSYTVRPGDEIADRYRPQPAARQGRARSSRLPRLPEWLAVDAKAGKGTFKAYPQRAELPATLNEGLVVELYSR